MSAQSESQTSERLSIVHGIPLEEEPGLGALTIAGYAREVTTRFAPREALVMHTPNGVVRWTYAELWERSVEIAKALVAAGIGKDGRVGILMTNRPEFIAGLFGTALAGGVTVALSTFSTPHELEYLLQASNVSVLLFDRQVVKKDFAAMLGGLEPQILTSAPGSLVSTKFPFLRRLVALESVTGGAADGALAGLGFETWPDFLAGGKRVSSAIVEARAATVTQADAAAVFFSSGTTNLPKGICHAQRAVAIQWWRWPRIMGVRPDVPVRSWTGNGFFWSGNISMVVGNALSTGGTVVLQPVFQPEEALDLMQNERVTMPIGRPHQWARLEAAPNWSSVNLSSLYYVIQGALANHPTVIRSGWTYPNAFGTTETLTINTAVSADTPAEKAAGSYGEPLPGNTLRILDPMTGAVVPRGQRGEIGIKGPTLMTGYLGKTLDETFDEEGFYRTGDGGYVDAEGRLFWEGRLTEIIKTGGANVSPIEIDATLAKFPGIKRAQTVGVPHEMLSEMVVSCIVPQDDAALDVEAVRGFLKERLASYKIPREILFFSEEELAVTGSGKVKIEILRDLATKRLAEEASGKTS